jgi:hypothetical protein
MTSDTYDQQRLDGARLIVERAIELAKAQGITLEKTEWDHGRAIGNRTKHTLSLTAKGKTITGELPDEWLADYPGRVGTEKATMMLKEMVRSLS